jgi:hypothetical protein
VVDEPFLQKHRRAALVLIAVMIYVADMDNNRVLKLPAQYAASLCR